MSDSLQPHGLQHARLPCPFPTTGIYSNSCPLSRWCHSTILFSVVPFSLRLQSCPATGSFPMSQFFPSGGQSIGVSASAPVLPMNNQDWSPLGWTGWISLQSKGLSRVFSNTTVQKHQFISAQLSLWSNSHLCTWLLEKHRNLDCLVNWKGKPQNKSNTGVGCHFLLHFLGQNSLIQSTPHSNADPTTWQPENDVKSRSSLPPLCSVLLVLPLLGHSSQVTTV